MIFIQHFLFFYLNPAIVIMKAPKHLLNTTEMTTSGNGVEVYHVKMLNGFI